jgi:membrane-bound lytic murein transglycosylase F
MESTRASRNAASWRLGTAATAALLLATCESPPSLLEQIKTTGELRVVTRNSPTTFYIGRDAVLGPEYDLVRGFATRLGVNLRIYTADQFWQILPDVMTGRAHLAAAGLTITPPRRDLVEFGPVYQRVDAQVIYKLGTGRPRTLQDLLGGRLEVVSGSSHAGLLERVRYREPLLSWIESPAADVEELVAKVASGEIDYTIVDSNEFAVTQHFYPEARAAFPLGPAGSLAWALPLVEDTSLREQVSAYFAELTASGELDRLLNRYYYYAGDFDYVGSRAFVRHFDARLPRYREYFMEAEETTGVDWRLLAAMGYQESHWNPDAVSPTGVRGIMMLTETTAEMVGVADRVDPRLSILGGAQYFTRVLRKIPERIGEPDRTWLALAAYNIGFGHLEDARVLTEMAGKNPDEWEDVRKHLPLLSQKKWYQRTKRGYARGWEPVYYVDNVRRYYDMLEWMTAGDSMDPIILEPVQELASR